VLRTNLSTRPFYNERAIHLLLGLVAVIVVILTAFNALRIVSLSRQNTELSSLINNDRTEAQKLTREAQRVRAGINQDELKSTADAADVANALIDQRTFSWTEFFNRIEETLPPDVMLSSVRPSVGDEGTVVQMSVIGRRAEDVDEFIEKLEATGAFENVLPTQEEQSDDGLRHFVVRANYNGAAVDAAEESKPAESKPAGTKPAEAAPAESKPAEANPPAPGEGRGAEPPPVAAPQEGPIGEGGSPPKPQPAPRGGRLGRGREGR
jgi:Tfp pilus assembly protein PilN